MREIAEFTDEMPHWFSKQLCGDDNSHFNHVQHVRYEIFTATTLIFTLQFRPI